MAHIPVNHHLQPLYRALAGLAGLYVLLFGVIGFIQTSGKDPFQQDDLPMVLGLRANPAFSILSIVAGIVILGAALVGRNVAHFVNLAVGVVFVVAGMAMLTLLRTDLNFLGFSMANCIVSFIIGMLLLAAGLYGKTGPAQAAQDEEDFRHGHVVREKFEAESHGASTHA